MKCCKSSLILVLLGLFLVVTSVCAQGENSTLFSFVSTTYDARSLGRASITSVSNNGNYVRGNPALAADISKANFSLGFQPYGFDTFNGFISGGFITPKGIAIAPSVHYVTYGTIEALDSLGAPLDGELAPFALVAATAVAYQWEQRFSVGGSFSVAYEKLSPKLGELIEETHGIAFLFDVGMLYSVSQVRLASGVRNLGFWRGYESDNADQWHLPVTLYASLLWSIPSKVPVGILFEMEKQKAFSLLFKGAFELSFKRDAFALRVGSSVSTDEIRELFSKESSEIYSYSKSSWHIFSTGFSFKVPVQQKSIFFDFGVGFRADGLDPQFSFSGGMDF